VYLRSQARLFCVDDSYLQAGIVALCVGWWDIYTAAGHNAHRVDAVSVGCGGRRGIVIERWIWLPRFGTRDYTASRPN
jgi:hypothetical protein